MQIADQGLKQIFWEGERIRECRRAACTGVLHFFGGGVAADMELAEEAGIVWIRDFTLRGLPMCNSFWRPWNCYCEKFSSCNSSTHSTQRAPPPLPSPSYTHNTHTTSTTPTFLWSTAEAVGGVNAMLWVLFVKFAAPKNIWVFVVNGWHISQTDASQCETVILWMCSRVGLPKTPNIFSPSAASCRGAHFAFISRVRFFLKLFFCYQETLLLDFFLQFSEH